MSGPRRRVARGLAIELAARAVKVALVAAVVLAVVSVASRTVEAEVDDAFLELGAQLIRYGGASTQDDAREIILNGSSIALSTGTTADPLATVLDRLAASCRSPEDALRKVTDDVGYVACIDGVSFRAADEASVGERLTELVDDLRSGDLGLRRFFYATRVDGRTRFFTMWAEEGLDASRLMPAGEAPGADLPGLPRLDGIVRRFSIGEVGQPYGLAVYTDDARSPAELEGLYLDALRRSGWTVRPSRDDGPAGRDQDPSRRAFVAARGDALAVVVARRAEDHSVLALALGASVFNE